MKVLVVGGGGREHAIAWKIAQSPDFESLIIAPGNAGTATLGENISVSDKDIPGLLRIARDRNVDLTVVGPEAPLSHGLVDIFRDAGMLVFGPTKAAARIESSKAFAKELMNRVGVPTATSETVTAQNLARNAVSDCELPVVIKVDGLAAGKGVIIAETRDEAVSTLTEIFDNRRFGNAGQKVLIEEYLRGQEISAFAFVDGERVSSLVTATDYKRAYDGDEGPNTGGMGSYSPSPIWDKAMETEIKNKVFQPVVSGMAEQGSPYTGMLYAGLMVTDEGPKVLEFNCRFGDPETQVVLPRLKSDLLDVLRRTAEGNLSSLKLEWDERPCVGVVMASGGYPDEYVTGNPITGLNNDVCDAIVFHAGTSNIGGVIQTSGGRVLAVSALGDTMGKARKQIYQVIESIHFDGAMYRKDIALNM
jgi:phosphoribosylamine--glycine ligase